MLKRSKYALEQLARGSNISPKSSSILDHFFRDDNLFDGGDLVGSYATPQTPISTSPSTVRGLPGIFMDKFFEKNLLRQPNLSTQDTFFTITYVPPWHPIAAGRSTRPAIVVCYKNGVVFNGKTVPQPAPKLGRSVFDYAVWRYKTKAIYKKLFMNAWNGLTTENGPRDGLYVLLVRMYPSREEHAEIQTKFSKYLRWIASKDRKLDSPAKNTKSALSPAELAAVNRKSPHYFAPQQWNWGYTK